VWVRIEGKAWEYWGGENGLLHLLWELERKSSVLQNKY